MLLTKIDAFSKLQDLEVKEREIDLLLLLAELKRSQ